MQDLIKEYVLLMKQDFKLALQFTITNRKLFRIQYNKNIVKELILNYKTRDSNQDGKKICQSFKKLIINKSIIFKSDMMIAVNILEKITINDDCKSFLISFLNNYLQLDTIINEAELIDLIKNKAGQKWVN